MPHAATAKTLALVAGILNLVLYGTLLLGLMVGPFLWFLFFRYYFLYPYLSAYVYTNILMTSGTCLMGTFVGFVALTLRPIVLKAPLGAGVPWMVFGAIGILTLGGMFLLAAGIVACVAARTEPPLRRRLPAQPPRLRQPEPPPYGSPEPVPPARPTWLPAQPSESSQSMEPEPVGTKSGTRAGKRHRAIKCAQCGGLLEPGDRYCMVCGSEVR